MTLRRFGIVGWKNSGKTTMTERLVAEFTARGFVVSTVKNAHHGFDIDQQGTDSFRHRAAGAAETAIVSGKRWAIMHEDRAGGGTSLDGIVARLSPCDLVLVEGFKSEPHPKIEMRRLAAAETVPMTKTVANIRAIAADHAVAGEDCPVFAIDGIAAIADFIAQEAGMGIAAKRRTAR